MREKVFLGVQKNDKHLHTNMAKAGVAMVTKCLAKSLPKTHAGRRIRVHGCDPGWISVYEYYEHSRPWIVPPLDEVDGAARILFPVFAKLKSCQKTRRHFDELLF